MLRRRKRITCFLVIAGLGMVAMIYTMHSWSHTNSKVDMSDFNEVSQKIQQDLPSEKVSKLNTFNDNEPPGLNKKTKVFRYNGKELERLHDFCTWSLPMDCATLKTPGGPMTVFIHDVEEDPGFSGVLKKTGLRDPDNVAIVINELMKYPDAGFFDFGSHIGVYGLSVAHTLGRNVVSMDPMIENTARLCKSIQFNNFTDKMSIVYNAISNANTRINFKRTYRHIGATKVVQTSSSDDSPCDNSIHYSVTLDDIIPIVSFKTAVMKLDVEMSEYFAIQGGQKFLQEIDVRSILMEWYNIIATPHVGPLVELMKQMSYLPYIPDVNGNHRLVKYEDYKSWTRYRQLLDVLWVKED